MTNRRGKPHINGRFVGCIHVVISGKKMKACTKRDNSGSEIILEENCVQIYYSVKCVLTYIKMSRCDAFEASSGCIILLNDWLKSVI